MIRPVLAVDLPSIVHALDTRARMKDGEFANFVVAPDVDEPRSGLAALLRVVLPITPKAHTWLAEEHWRPLGLAQARIRPGAQAWDLAYLATIVPSAGQSHRVAQEDVLHELIQYALNAAMMRGAHRFFTRVEEDRAELEIFARLGFQRYAREVTYYLPSAREALAQLDAPAPRAFVVATRPHLRLVRRSEPLAPQAPTEASSETPAPLGAAAEVSLRRWHPHDAWGLMRLYSACTPHLVQVAESLTSDELVYTRAAGGRTWTLPLLEPRAVALVCDRGVRLGGWLRLRLGRGSQPHMLSVLAHPDDPEVGPALLRFALQELAPHSPCPILCQVRDYEGSVVDALRAAGFEQVFAHALLIRHLTARVARSREVAAAEPRVVYGVKGFAHSPTRLSEGEKTYYARDKT